MLGIISLALIGLSLLLVLLICLAVWGVVCTGSFRCLGLLCYGFAIRDAAILFLVLGLVGLVVDKIVSLF